MTSVARLLAGWRFRGIRPLAAHVLRFGGSVAGAIDGCRDGCVTGWIYDVARPGSVLELEVLVDGLPEARGRASEVRADLIPILGGDGRHGFAIVVDALAAPNPRRRQVGVRLVDAPREEMRPVSVEASWDAGRSALAGVGCFTEARLDDEVEAAIFRSRLVGEISRTRAG